MELDLTNIKCVPCEGGVPPLTTEQILHFQERLTGEWEVIQNKKIKREFSFADFKEAMVFVNKVAALAEEEGHHPDVHIFYNKVVIELWTHAVGGLSQNDFILAAKIERL